MDSTKEIEGILLRAGNYINGRDSDDPTLTYDSIMEWRESIGLTCAQEQRNDTSRHEWYTTGFDYWEDESNCPATVDGVLGGFSCLSKKDLDGSMEFMRYMKSTLRPELKFTVEENGGTPTRACECGAGKYVGYSSRMTLQHVGNIIVNVLSRSLCALKTLSDRIRHWQSFQRSTTTSWYYTMRFSGTISSLNFICT